MSDFNDLFNLSVEDFKEERKEKTFERFNPQAKDGEGNVYSAVVRFLPWYKEPKTSEKKKRVCWLENKATGDKRYIDCPSSIGQKDILQDLFFKYKKSESARDREISEAFKSTQKFAALVQVVKDKQHPETEGKIMVFQYGIKIHEKIEALMKPEYGKPCIPFDLFSGRPMQISVTLKAGYNNFDNCQFLGEAMPITIDGVEMQKTPEDMAKLAEWLKTNSPDLDRYGFQPWDAETEAFVNAAIKAILPNERVMSEIKTSAAKEAVKAPSQAVVETVEAPAPKEESAEDFDINDINFDGELDDDDLYSKL